MDNNYSFPNFSIVQTAEDAHNRTDADRKALSLSDCVTMAAKINEMIDGFHDFRHELVTENADELEAAGFTPDDVPEITQYRQVRDFIKAIDLADGGNNTRKADRRLMAAYICVMRGIPTEQEATQ